MNGDIWRGKNVFVTGHTGFKGGWLALWLAQAGAHVHGYALSPPTEPNLFQATGLLNLLASHVVADIREPSTLQRALSAAAPEVVFHMAAQPLVRYSYHEPVETYETNVMGTVHLLEAVRKVAGVRAVVSVTTDKCYDNKEWLWGYREDEALGGRDPYSSSKACAEIVTAAYRDSFLRKAGVAVATARAGNVIGGGDWAADRLLPDFFRALDTRQPLEVRFPSATRPWQHVLEPLSGYLKLAEHLLVAGDAVAESWNFGPADDDARPVGWILDRLVAAAPEARWRQQTGEQLHEAGYLKLDSSKARQRLQWQPKWDLARALDMTLAWHRAWRAGDDMRHFSLQQIASHQAAVEPLNRRNDASAT